MDLAGISIKRPIFISCIFILTLVVGALALKSLPVDQFPDVTFPVVTINTPYPGAGPLEVETQVSKVIEDEVSSIAGIKSVRSINREGLSIVISEFTLKTDIKYAEQKVRDAVSATRRKMPADIDEPIIRRIDPADQPILSLSLKADVSPADLFDLANEVIKPKLQQVDQVGLVDILGARKREIRVELDQSKLRAHEIPASLVSARIASAGENVPAGKVTDQNSELVYRTLAEFQSLNDIGAVIVSFLGDERPVRVRDLGRVVDTLAEEKSRVYYNGVPSLTLQVFRQTGSNTLAVVDAVKKTVDKLNLQYKDDKRKIALSSVRDGSKVIKNNVEDVEESILLGIVLTIIVVLLFLGNLRSTLITSLALPNSLLGAFVLMMIAGFTINIMSLLALSLAVGLLIDDAIVVRENIFRHLEMGKSPRQAALDGTKEVTLAVIATTMTVIAVFGPIGFLQGVVGQFFKQFGLTICFAMLISLYDALTMAPMMSAYFAGSLSHDKTKSNPALWKFWTWPGRALGSVLSGFDWFQNKMENGYESLLGGVLRFPKTTILLAVLIFIGSIQILKFVPKTFMPPQDNGEFNVKLELPPGVSMDEMDDVAKKVDATLRRNPEIEGALLVTGSQEGESNLASIFVRLVPSKLRKVNTSQMKDRVRDQLKEFAFAKPIVMDMDMASGGGQRAFTVFISGPDLVQLETYSHQVYDRFEDHAGLKDVEYGYKPGKPEFQFVLDPEKAERLGVSTKTAGLELRTLVEGMVPAVLRSKGIEYDIRVRSQDDQRTLKNRLHEISVPNLNNRFVRMETISTPKSLTGPAVIYRKDRNRYISLMADLAPKGVGMGGVIEDFKKLISTDLPLPAGVTYTFTGQAENFQELMVSMMIAMGLGILFIYLVLSSLYESFITPFTIMLVLPLALCGAFYALFLTGKSMDLFSMIGCVMLLGVATKNSILFVDYTKQLVRDGMKQRSAILRAGRTRLRPILMTSFALIAGMLPVAIGLNEASKPRTSMGIAIIGGLISSTLLTLVVIPAAYGYIERFGGLVNRLFKRIAGDADTTSHDDHGSPAAQVGA